jgi:hypothetical protein
LGFEKIWVLTLSQTAAFLAAGLLADGRQPYFTGLWKGCPSTVQSNGFAGKNRATYH